MRIKGNACLNNKKLVHGAGINDGVATHIVNGKKVMFKSYQCWASILNRCYGDKFLVNNPAYIGCSIAKEWRLYSNFKRFHDDNYVEGFELDKDLLVKGNRVYSPENCVFIPSALNKLFTDHAANRGEFPIGVHFDKKRGKYKAQCNVHSKPYHIGYFDTPELASVAYQSFKRSYVLSELAAYRATYSDNNTLMNLLNVLESRIIS